jgi:two-component system, NtrC family, response regulator HydG
MAHILVVDDERSTLEALSTILRREGHVVLTAVSAQEALAQLEEGEELDLLLSDVRMPKMDGLELLRHIKAHQAEIVVIMMSGHQDVTAAVEAMKAGAFDYLVKPFGREEVVRTIQKALAHRSLLVENLALRRQVRYQGARSQVIGSSPAWRKVCEMVEQIAPSRATVLIAGESGTGKELIAGLIHQLSPRADRPFVTLNAAALPATLLEAELFGHEKGAFTGAQQRKLGRFELADGGTLFLDEIGDMPPEVQVKILRVLQDGTFERLGSTRTLQVDVRVVAATNKDLMQEVEAGRWRLDLYYRLNVISLRLPALRERREDIPLLVAHFLRKYAAQNNKQVTGIQQQVLQFLQHADWPGNVRELENVIERAVVLAKDPIIGIAELPGHIQEKELAPTSGDHFALPLNATLAEIEREAIVQALQHSGGNRQATARSLNIGLATLYRKLKEYQLQ